MWTSPHQEDCDNPTAVTFTWTNTCGVKMPVSSCAGGGHAGTETGSGRIGLMPLGDTLTPLFTPMLLIFRSLDLCSVHSGFVTQHLSVSVKWLLSKAQLASHSHTHTTLGSELIYKVLNNLGFSVFDTSTCGREEPRIKPSILWSEDVLLYLLSHILISSYCESVIIVIL